LVIVDVSTLGADVNRWYAVAILIVAVAVGLFLFYPWAPEACADDMGDCGGISSFFVVSVLGFAALVSVLFGAIRGSTSRH
jgi:NADH:ubiquinone oxidoreductase subunit 3 (subunit A)